MEPYVEVYELTFFDENGYEVARKEFKGNWQDADEFGFTELENGFEADYFDKELVNVEVSNEG